VSKKNQIALIKEDWKRDPQSAQYLQQINRCMVEVLDNHLHRSAVIVDADSAHDWQLVVEFAFPRIKPQGWQSGAVLTSNWVGKEISDCLHKWGKPISSWDDSKLRDTKKQNVVICPFNPLGPDSVIMATRLGSLADVLAPLLLRLLASPQNR
jgi:hypothetical protein